MRTTRPVVLLALVALLTPCAEASRTRVWESNPPAAVFAKTDAAGQLAPLAPAARLDTGAARDAEIAEPQRFDLGGLVFIESELEHEDGFGLGPLELLGPTPLRGPPPSYPETRVGGFELLPPFRVGPSASLSLWSRQACGSTSCELASDSPEDPWGLQAAEYQQDLAEYEGSRNRVRTATGVMAAYSGGVASTLEAGLDLGPGIGSVMEAARLVDMVRTGQTMQAMRAAGYTVAAIAGLRYAMSVAPHLFRVGRQWTKAEFDEIKRIVKSRPRSAARVLESSLEEAEQARAAAGRLTRGAASESRAGYRGLSPHPTDPNIAGGYRGRYFAAARSEGLPELPSNWDVHHSIPQSLRGDPRIAGIDIDAPENLRGVPGYRLPGMESNVHTVLDKEWARYLAANPGATREDILEFRDKLDWQYGQHYWENVARSR